MSQQLSSNVETDKAREREELRQRMAIQKQVELHLNRLINSMVNLLDDSQAAHSRLEKSQIKNLLATALETNSVEVVKYYILYQVGRDTPGSTWRQNEFGKKLVKAIDTLKKEAEQIHRELRLPSEVGLDETWLLLTRAYLGQLNRYFYYQKEEYYQQKEARV